MCCLPLSKHARGVTMHTVSENKHSVHLGKQPSISHVSDVGHWFVIQSGSPIWNQLWRITASIKVLSSRSECEGGAQRLEICHSQCGRSERDITLCASCGEGEEFVMAFFFTVTGDGRVVPLVSQQGEKMCSSQKDDKISAQPRQFCKMSVSQGVGALWLWDLMAGRAARIVGLLTFSKCAAWVSGDSAAMLRAFTLSLAVKLNHSATVPWKRI